MSDERKILTFPLTLGYIDRPDDLAIEAPFNFESENLRTGYRPGKVPTRPPMIDPTRVQTFTTQASPSTDPYTPQAAAFASSTGDLLIYSKLYERPSIVNTVRQAKLNSPKLGSNSYLENATFPVQIDRSTMVVGGKVYPNYAVTALSNGHRVIASYTSEDWTLTVLVLDENDNTVYGPVDFSTGTNDSTTHSIPVAITGHGTNAAVWYHYNNAGTVSINVRRLVRSGATYTLGADTLVTNQVSMVPWAVGSAGDDDYAYLSSQNSAVDTTVTMRVYNVTTDTTTSVQNYATEIDSGDANAMCIHVVKLVTTTYVSAGWRKTAGTTVRGITKTALAGAWSTDQVPLDNIMTVTVADRISVALIVNQSNSILITYACSDLGEFRPLAAHRMPYTKFAVRDVLVTNTFLLPSMKLISNGVSYRPSTASNFMVALFGMIRTNGSSSTNDPSTDLYVSDPSIELYAVQEVASARYSASPIARMGVNEAQLYFAYTLNTLNVSNDRFNFIYAFTDSRVQSYISQGARLISGILYGDYNDADWCGPARTSTLINTSMIACGQPLAWDGKDAYEVGFLHAPWLTASLNGGTSAITGSLSFSAIYTYRNAGGELVRSAPAFPITLNCGTGAKPQLTCSIPDTMRNGTLQQGYNVELYATAITGSIWYILPAASASFDQTGITWLSLSTGSTDQAEIYTDGNVGSELESTAPGALWDTVVSNSRIFGIDAVRRNRIVHTKKKVTGISYEWNDALDINLDGSAGRAIALSELNGYVVVFCENGIYTIGGDGPDAGGGGSYFSPPQLTSLVRTNPMARNSVCKTSAGILFESTRGVCLLKPDFSVQMFEGLAQPTGTRLGAMGFRSANDAVLQTSDERVLLDLAQGTQQHWVPSGIPSYNHVVSFYPVDFKGSLGTTEGFYAITTGGTYACTASRNEDTSAEWSLTTGWIAPAGFTGDVSFHEYVIAMRLYAADCEITVGEEYDWVDGVINTATFTSSSIAAAASSGGQLVYLRVKPSNPQAQAVRLTITQVTATGLGLVPIELHVEHDINSVSARRFSTQPM